MKKVLVIGGIAVAAGIATLVGGAYYTDKKDAAEINAKADELYANLDSMRQREAENLWKRNIVNNKLLFPSEVAQFRLDACSNCPMK